MKVGVTITQGYAGKAETVKKRGVITQRHYIENIFMKWALEIGTNIEF